MMVLRKMMHLSTTPWEVATSWLLIGAIFFAMRSCEFLQTTSREESKRTKILRLRNVQFTLQGKILPHSHPQLEECDIVIITFEFQKNDTRDTQIHMFKTSDHLLNPVKAWAKTIQRVRGYPGASDDTTVCAFLDGDGFMTTIQSDQVRPRLRAMAAILGKAQLGFDPNEIGLHSLRSGGAMAMFLSGISTIVIRRIGRWSSEAFLEYIREQVQDFTAGVAQKMLNYENFTNLSSNIVATTKVENNVVDKKDGPTPVPVAVQFSDLALDSDDNPRGRRKPRR